MKVKVKVILIIAAILGPKSNNLEKKLSGSGDLTKNGDRHTTGLMRSDRILRGVLKTRGNLLSLGLL